MASSLDRLRARVCAGVGSHKFGERFGIGRTIGSSTAAPREPSLKTKNWLRSRQSPSPRRGLPWVGVSAGTQLARAGLAIRGRLLESPAMRALNLAAIRVMHRLEVEHMNHGGAENGRLIVTHDQFIEWGVPRNAVSPAIRELVALGFVEVTEKALQGMPLSRPGTI